MKSGFIKQYRRELESDIWLMPPLYGRVWKFILLKVKWKKETFPTIKKFGIHLNPGQLITSYDNIAHGVKWTEKGRERIPNKKTIKDIIDWLVFQEMVTVVSNAYGTFISVINWDIYQGLNGDKVTGESNAKETENKRLLDTIKELNKKLKEVEEKNKQPKDTRFEARLYLSEKGIKKQHIDEFLKIRKTKRLTPTETAFDRLGVEFEKAGLTWEAGIQKCIVHSWGGFKASWLEEDSQAQPNYNTAEKQKEILLREMME